MISPPRNVSNLPQQSVFEVTRVYYSNFAHVEGKPIGLFNSASSKIIILFAPASFLRLGSFLPSFVPSIAKSAAIYFSIHFQVR